MNRNPQDYLDDLLNDELWGELTPTEQVALVGNTRAQAQANLGSLNSRLSDKEVAMTGYQRAELHRKRRSTVTFIDLLTQRAQRAKELQKRENMTLAENMNGVKYRTLREAVVAHRETTGSTDDPNVIAEADDALYARLDEMDAI